jgi:hypothetical protein
MQIPWLCCPSARSISFTHHRNTSTTGRKSSTPAEAKNINRLIVQFAHKNVYASIESEDVRALVDAEIDKVIFGKTAFVQTPK